MDNFGQRLKNERERLGLTQKELAEAVSISYVTQSNYETGKRKPDTKYIASIATIGFDLKYLFTDTREENSPLAPEERVVLQCYREASPAIRKGCTCGIGVRRNWEWRAKCDGKRQRDRGCRRSYHQRERGISLKKGKESCSSSFF